MNITEYSNMWKLKKPTQQRTVSEDKIEHCVLCHKPLDISLSVPVDLREHYICGCGQLCADCYGEIAQDLQDIIANGNSLFSKQ